MENNRESSHSLIHVFLRYSNVEGALTDSVAPYLQLLIYHVHTEKCYVESNKCDTYDN